MLRKDMKQRFARKNAKLKNKEKRYAMLCSYKGWCMHGDCKHLWKTITGMNNFKDLNIKAKNINKDGKRFFDVETVSLMDILNQSIVVEDFETGVKTKNGNDRYAVLINYQGKACKFITNNYKMKDILDQCRSNNCFPFTATIKRKPTNNNKADYYFE